MDCPREFSREARAKVAAAELEANRDYNRVQIGAPPLSSMEGRLLFIAANSRWMATIFGAYAHEVCELGRRDVWDADYAIDKADDAKNRLTMTVRERCEQFRLRFQEIPRHWTDELIQEILGCFATSAEWKQYESEALAIAKQHSQPEAVPGTLTSNAIYLPPPQLAALGEQGRSSQEHFDPVPKAKELIDAFCEKHAPCSLDDLADKAKIDRRQVFKIRSGKPVRPYARVALAVVLGVDPKALLP